MPTELSEEKRKHLDTRLQLWHHVQKVYAVLPGPALSHKLNDHLATGAKIRHVIYQAAGTLRKGQPLVDVVGVLFEAAAMLTFVRTVKTRQDTHSLQAVIELVLIDPEHEDTDVAFFRNIFSGVATIHPHQDVRIDAHSSLQEWEASLLKEKCTRETAFLQRGLPLFLLHKYSKYVLECGVIFSYDLWTHHQNADPEKNLIESAGMREAIKHHSNILALHYHPEITLTDLKVPHYKELTQEQEKALRDNMKIIRQEISTDMLARGGHVGFMKEDDFEEAIRWYRHASFFIHKDLQR